MSAARFHMLFVNMHQRVSPYLLEHGFHFVLGKPQGSAQNAKTNLDVIPLCLLSAQGTPVNAAAVEKNH
jgi:hypothetical protein